MAKSVARGRIGNYTRKQLEQIIKNVSPTTAAGSGDITSVVAGTGLSGGATSGAATLNLDVSELTALGATAATSDFVVIQDATDNSTKKVLISNLPSSSLDIDTFSALAGATVHLTQDHFLVSDNGTEKKVLFEDLQNSIFSNVGGDATIAASGSLTIATDAVESGMLNDNVISGQAALAGATAHLTQDYLLFSDNGTLKKVLFEDLQNSILANITGDATVAASGSLTIAAASIENSMLSGSITAAKMANEIFADLEALGSVSADGNFIVADGSGSFAYESANTARTSLGVGTGNSPQFTGLTLTGTGSVQGDLTVSGDLTVNGTTTTVNSTEVTVVDKALVLASGSNNSAIASAGGAGLKFGHESGAGLLATMLYDGADSFDFNHHVNVASSKGYQVNGTSVLTADGATKVQSGVAGTGLSHSSGELSLDLAAVIASDAGNRLLTSDGDGTLTAEANVTYDGTTFVVDSTLSASTNISGSEIHAVEYYGNGSKLTGVTGTISAVANAANDRLVTFSSADALNGEANLTFNSANLLTVSGNITASINVSASAFYGDGSNLSGIAGTITALNNQAESRLVTVGATTTELDGEANLTYDGTTFVIGDDARVNDDLPLYFGTNNDAYIKYNEAADDFLIISGSANGLALSGSTITLAGLAQFGAGAHVPDEQKIFFGTNQDAFIRYSDPGVLDDFLTVSGSARGIVLSGSTVKVDGTLAILNASASTNISASAFYGDGANITNVPIDLNSLSAAAVNVANDSIAFVDADGSNASKKESISDFVSAVQGDGLQATSGVMNIDVSDFAGAGLKDDGSENLDLDISDSGLTTVTGFSSGDLMLISDESETNDPTRNITVDNLFKSGSALVADDAPTVASDYALFLKGGASGEMIKESIADFIGAIAGTGIGSSSGQLTHPITAVNSKANDRLITIGNTTSEMDGEANLSFANSQVLELTGTMVITSSANHLKAAYDGSNYSTFSVASNGTTTLFVTGTTGANSAFVVNTSGDIKLDTGNQVTFQQNGQGFLLAQTNATSHVTLVPTGSDASVDLKFANSANDKQIAAISSSINALVLNQHLAFSSPTKLTHPTIIGGSSGPSHQSWSANQGSLFFMFSGTGTGDHLTGTLPNPVAIGQQCVVVAMSPNSNSSAVVRYNGQSQISSSAMVEKKMTSASDAPAATIFFSTQLYNADGSAGSVVWAPLEIGSTTSGDITGVTAGDGLSGGGATGALSLALDLNELSAAAVAVAADSIAIIDADDNSSKKESIADFVSAIAGTGLDAASGQLTVDVSEVIASDADNRLLTSDGDGTMTAEANISYDGTTFTIDDDMMIKDDHKFHFGTNSDGFIQYREASDDYLVMSGSGNGLALSGSNIINAGFVQMYTGGMVVDDQKLYFGNNFDSFIEYNENGDDYMTISGSGNGIVLSGSTIQIAGTLEGASPLRIAGEVQFVNQGDAAAFKFGPNGEANLHFGTDNYLTIKGSNAKGTVLSGSAVEIQTTNGLGVFVAGDDITHAITLPNNSQANRGQIKANAFVSYSSARYKDNIAILEDPMAVLSQIEGVSFKWKDTGHQDYGFIAEEVGKVLPSIVSWEDNKKDAQGMDYLKIISFLVEATKKQQKEIDELKQRLK